jgi:hypothetical protein
MVTDDCHVINAEATGGLGLKALKIAALKASIKR